MSMPSESSKSYKTYTPAESVETSKSTEVPTESVGSEATSAGSKKKKASSGGFPPVDNTIVTGPREPDTAMAIRGKPAHSEEPRTKGGTDGSGGGSSDNSGRIGKTIEKAAQDAIDEAKRLPKNLWEQPLGVWFPVGPAYGPNFVSPKDIFNEGKRAYGNISDFTHKAGQDARKEIGSIPGNVTTTGKNFGDTIEKAGRDIGAEAGRLPGNLEKGGKALEEQLQYDVDGLREGKMPVVLPNVGESEFNQLIKEGKRTMVDPVGDAIQKIERLPADLSSRTYGIDDVIRDRVTAPAAKAIEAEYGRARDQLGKLEGKAGAEIGKGMKKAGDIISDAQDKAGDVVNEARKKAEETLQQGQDAAEDAGNSVSDTAEQGCDAVAGAFGGNC